MDNFSICKKLIKASSVKLVEKGEPLERAQSCLHNSDRAHHARPPSSSDIYGPRERNSKKSYMGRGDAVQMDEVKQARKSKKFSHPAWLISAKILEAGLYLIHT